MSGGVILGEIPATCGHGEDYWRDRDCFVDARGPLVVHPSSHFGYQVMLLTLSHDVSGGAFVPYSPCVERGVTVDEGAFICSRASLYNCHVGAFAIVAFGAVVRSQYVPPRVIVAGNPAYVIAEWTEWADGSASWAWREPRYEGKRE